MAKKKVVPMTMKMAEAKWQKEQDRRVARIKQAIVGAKFYDWELTEIERTVFAAFGRTKIGAHI